MSERPIGCLLSYGLDSSLVTALVFKCFNQKVKLYTFSRIKRSEDLAMAQWLLII